MIFSSIFQGLGPIPVTSFSVSSVTQSCEFCLSGDTLITLYAGGAVRMDALRYDHILLGMDGEPAMIKKLMRGSFNRSHTKYYFDGGIVIDETHEHRFYNHDQGYWAKLKDWNVGDRAVDREGNLFALREVERLAEPAEMFGLWTDQYNYYANGLLSGDARANLSLVAHGDLALAKAVLNSVSPEEWFSVMEGRAV